VNLALLIVVLAADPQSAISTDRIAALQTTLNEAEARWRSVAPARYRYRLISGGPFYYTTYLIVVNGGECHARARAHFGKKPAAWKPASCDGHTVADILSEVRRQLSFPQERIELAFDPTYGYPISASFEPHSGIEDQSEYFEIEAFKAYRRHQE
jgi:hypothetical protein